MNSLLDGYSKVQEYAEYSKEVNQKYLCITDHGTMGAIPQQVAQADKHKLTPLYGCELYVNPMQFEAKDRYETQAFRAALETDEEKKRFSKNHHLLAIAYTDEGYSNLVQISSWGWIHGFYFRPRVNHEVLMRHKEGIIFTSTCANSEIANAFFAGGDEAGFAMIEKYMAMFGENFYLELMMLDFKLQKPYDAFLLRAREKYGLPFFLSCDCHYCLKEHSENQRLTLMMQKGRTMQEMDALIASGADDIFELQDTNLWMKSEDELNEKWESDYQDTIDYDLFMQAKATTVEICRKAGNVQIDRSLKLPRFPNDNEKLLEEIKAGFVRRKLPMTKEYSKRIMEEYNLFVEKGFCSYFLILTMMIDEARREGPRIMGWGRPEDALGPGRGSICGSLAAYCLGIHDIEPVKHDLLFSRFLSPARGGKQMKVRFTIDPITGVENEA